MSQARAPQTNPQRASTRKVYEYGARVIARQPWSASILAGES